MTYRQFLRLIEYLHQHIQTSSHENHPDIIYVEDIPAYGILTDTHTAQNKELSFGTQTESIKCTENYHIEDTDISTQFSKAILMLNRDRYYQKFPIDENGIIESESVFIEGLESFYNSIINRGYYTQDIDYQTVKIEELII